MALALVPQRHALGFVSFYHCVWGQTWFCVLLPLRLVTNSGIPYPRAGLVCGGRLQTICSSLRCNGYCTPGTLALANSIPFLVAIISFLFNNQIPFLIESY
jgi:hypothetical protein